MGPTKRLAIVLLLLAFLAPVAAHAQGNDPPPPTPAPPPLAFESLPDLLPYVSFQVPRCGECDGPRLDYPAEPAPTVDWKDPFSPFNWLGWQIRDLLRQLICWLMNILQYLANILTVFANTIISGINYIWRLALYVYLVFRSWFYEAFYLIEVLRDWGQTFNGWIVYLYVWAQALINLILTGLQLGGQLLGVLLNIALGLLNLLGWVGGLALGLIASITVAIQGTTVPIQLGGTHPIYQMVRGMGQGIADSNLGWLLYLAWAMAYVSFVAWLARYLSAGPEEA